MKVSFLHQAFRTQSALWTTKTQRVLCTTSVSNHILHPDHTSTVALWTPKSTFVTDRTLLLSSAYILDICCTMFSLIGRQQSEKYKELQISTDWFCGVVCKARAPKKKKGRSWPVYVYELQCLPTGRKYFGISATPKKRFQAHALTPPVRMRHDVEKYTPFSQFFEMTIIHCYPSRRQAKQREAALIHDEATRGPGGYNTSPGYTQDFVWLRRR
jgi:predicted GIY-YIG superfamily endonuclease